MAYHAQVRLGPGDDKPIIEEHYFRATTFNNPQHWTTWRTQGIVDYFAMKMELSHAEVPYGHEEELNSHLPVHELDEESNNKLNNSPDDGLQIMWIGHATLLVQFDGLNILTDPVFLKRCSPSQLVGPKRYRPVPCMIDQLPEINAVLISHNHYDHLEYDAVVKLNKRFGDKIRWFVPMMLKYWFIECGCSNVVEMTWWEKNTYDKTTYDVLSETSSRSSGVSVEHNGSAVFICVPAQHGSQRTPTDAMKSLWCGWVVKSKKGHTFYYTGDTGYCPVFKTIGERFGPMDLSAIPIGCYSPKKFHQHQYVNPAEAVMIHREVRSERSVGIHWGTFDGLGDEHYLEPREKLREECQKLREDEFFTVDHGEIKFIPYKTEELA